MAQYVIGVMALAPMTKMPKGKLKTLEIFTSKLDAIEAWRALIQRERAAYILDRMNTKGKLVSFTIANIISEELCFKLRRIRKANTTWPADGFFVDIGDTAYYLRIREEKHAGKSRRSKSSVRAVSGVLPDNPASRP